MGRRKKAFTNYEINKNIAKTLVLHRIWNGYTQTDIAKCLRVSFQQIQKYERCINRLAAENLIDICKQKNGIFNYLLMINQKQYLKNGVKM